MHPPSKSRFLSRAHLTRFNHSSIMLWRLSENASALFGYQLALWCCARHLRDNEKNKRDCYIIIETRIEKYSYVCFNEKLHEFLANLMNTPSELTQGKINKFELCEQGKRSVFVHGFVDIHVRLPPPPPSRERGGGEGCFSRLWKYIRLIHIVEGFYKVLDLWTVRRFRMKVIIVYIETGCEWCIITGKESILSIATSAKSNRTSAEQTHKVNGR